MVSIHWDLSYSEERKNVPVDFPIAAFTLKMRFGDAKTN